MYIYLSDILYNTLTVELCIFKQILRWVSFVRKIWIKRKWAADVLSVKCLRSVAGFQVVHICYARSQKRSHSLYLVLYVIPVLGEKGLTQQPLWQPSILLRLVRATHWLIS